MLVDFWVPAVPPSKNVYRMSRKKLAGSGRTSHWSQRARDLETWVKWIMIRAPRMVEPLAGPLVVEITFHTLRKSDPGNRHELLLDAMRKRVIVDDDSDTIAELRLRRRRRTRWTESGPQWREATHVRIWRAEEES